MKRFILVFVLASAFLAGCAAQTEPVSVEPSTEQAPQVTEPAAVPTETPAQAGATGKILFKIVKADGTSFDVTLDAVKALPLVQIEAEGKVEEGPFLKDVLALAGVTEFTEVSLSGSSNPVTLTFEQVDENTILDFNNHGTMKLASTYIPKPEWTKDVAEIVVK